MRIIRTLVFVAAAAAALVPARASAQSNLDRLAIYGFLNQGYGLSSAKPILGLNKDATGDYRAAALQVRYAVSSADNFVVQAGSRSLGTSPYSSNPGTIALDWAFYHHRFEHSNIRVGRIPAPFGFLSETREVGTLLPFYRAPAGFYLESFRSVDGAMFTSEIPFVAGSFETNLFAGGTNGTIATWLPTTVVTTRLRFERLVGGDITYATPIQGIRLRGGIASLRSLDTATVQQVPASKLALLNGGLEASYDRFFARGESRRIKIGSNQKQYSHYAQAGVRPLEKLWVNGQLDLGSVEQYVPQLGGYVGRASADRAVGLSYQFAPTIVAKLEQHFAKGGVDAFVAPNAETPYTNYSIASLAVSF